MNLARGRQELNKGMECTSAIIQVTVCNSDGNCHHHDFRLR